jgi:hypothetical protein
MFFGTPHAGANGAQFQAALTNICRIFVPGNSESLRHLSPASSHLQYLSELYVPISQDFKTIFFHEAYKTPLIGGMSMMVMFKVFLYAINPAYKACRLYQQPQPLFRQLMLMPFPLTKIISAW